jgi:hypothetical protein
MKRFIAVAIALLLALSVAPAMAGDDLLANQGTLTFHALSTMSTAERAALTPLTGEQLAAINGGLFVALGSALGDFVCALTACNQPPPPPPPPRGGAGSGAEGASGNPGTGGTGGTAGR